MEKVVIIGSGPGLHRGVVLRARQPFAPLVRGRTKQRHPPRRPTHDHDRSRKLSRFSRRRYRPGNDGVVQEAGRALWRAHRIENDFVGRLLKPSLHRRCREGIMAGQVHHHRHRRDRQVSRPAFGRNLYEPRRLRVRHLRRRPPPLSQQAPRRRRRRRYRHGRSALPHELREQGSYRPPARQIRAKSWRTAIANRRSCEWN